MVGQVFAKVLELAAQEFQDDLKTYEIEDRLLNALQNKELQFDTPESERGCIQFHSIGAGKEKPSTIVNLQIDGIEFEVEQDRLSLDFRYIYYQAFGHQLFYGTPSEFLITSPVVQKLGSENILIEFVLYGNTVYQVNRCLSMFSEIVRRYKDDLHQRALEKCREEEVMKDGDLVVSLDHAITDSEVDPMENPRRFLQSRVQDEQYIQDYVRYVKGIDDFRDVIDGKNTFAKTQF